MAADLHSGFFSCLPSSWSYGVTQDGRIFFINEETESTTWLHPVTGEAVITGHRKSPDLPTGWEEGFTFEGARCFINHNERKVTCKHPMSGAPSQDNCIFVVSEQSAPKSSPELSTCSDMKEDAVINKSETSSYMSGPHYSTFPRSNTITDSRTATTQGTASSTRLSRSFKKVHNFGKRSNSIKRNPNAPVVKSSWLYKQDSTGMKLWKKRWFVLSDMCLFYYRDDKEDSILGSILLPSFHISMLSVDDHISRKYAFKATHPNMRTYYFCTDTAKEMESWMKVMTDAALVYSEPTRRTNKSKVEQRLPQQFNNLVNHRALTSPEIQNNESNREHTRQHSISHADDNRQIDLKKHGSQQECMYYTLQQDSLKRDGSKCLKQKEEEKNLVHKNGEKYLLQKDGENCYLPKDEEVHGIHRDSEKYNIVKVGDKYTVSQEKHALSKDGGKYLFARNGDKYAMQKSEDRHASLKGQKCVSHKEVKRHPSSREAEKYCTMRVGENIYGTLQVANKYGTLRDMKKYNTLQEGRKYATLRDAEKYATVRNVGKYSLQREPIIERSIIKNSSNRLQPVQVAAVSTSPLGQTCLTEEKTAWVQNSESGVKTKEQSDLNSRTEPAESGQCVGPGTYPAAGQKDEKDLDRANFMQQLERWVHTQRSKGLEDDIRSVTSYQTLPRNMPSHSAQIVNHYPEGYRTMPRNRMVRPGSICSTAGSVFDLALHRNSTAMTAVEKRRSLKDITMWQLYEWQQRQAFSRQSLAQPTAIGHYCTLPSSKTINTISEHTVAHSIPSSTSHGSLALYSTFSAFCQQIAHKPANVSEDPSQVFPRNGTLDCRQRARLAKYGNPTDPQSVAPASLPQTITAQSLQRKTPEELTLELIKLRRKQAELNSLREHTTAQLMALGLEGSNAKNDVLLHHLQRNIVYLDSQTKENEPLIFMIHTMIENSAPRPQLYQQVGTDYCKDNVHHADEADVDVRNCQTHSLTHLYWPIFRSVYVCLCVCTCQTKLSRLCEQDKAVRTQEEKMQQLHREKDTLETALLSASQELSEQSDCSAAATQSLGQQRDVLQSGLLSTYRELYRVNTELEQSWKEYNRLEADVNLTKSNLLEKLEALGSPQTEPPSQWHIQIQKELWRIQDVMEALSKNRQQCRTENEIPGSKPLFSLQKNETLPLLKPLEEGGAMPPRPPLPQCYHSSERPSHLPPHHLHHNGCLPHQAAKSDDPKTASRNGAYNQGSDYRLCKSEPELTTVKEEVDEEKEKTEPPAESKDTAVSKVPPCPVGIVPPRTKSPINPPESSTIASYVTLRKNKKPEYKSNRPRSSTDQSDFSLGVREIGRARMSLEEQLERIRRNQEAPLLREKRRETYCRSTTDNTLLVPQTQAQPKRICADTVKLEAALQQLKLDLTEQSRTPAESAPQPADAQALSPERQETEEATNENLEQCRHATLHSVKEQLEESNSTDG
ncbi:pleckstrin homology domain-containing family A member 5-like isoform X2 [Cynoglossus semilaevis]|uniref:pleckstrin homology domain-containing family A member 5-like isoform X2 n=1 Tax=Cynoglossus semilaevis TaxID=244447 RepID=UPI000496ADAE|nr:pleckstrin homology domain-containing family A member 5-like isoform X2 [Cynoglossus semilaevis]